ncbi:MAG: nitrilase-related carbon-nitrogen hydrolase [Candidatus Krumholzibacteria bacterium]|nr:nitrilase-related carbon-nitrogen hydrolase [Candidatus Krumholzibacteria bacterium]MDP6669317.1 nitrilase-related carbon-nitrogen hydrolase [Candidatus Krumholzibacteria bacterium]MDP6797478.1 nitrilase-related carbon-nitrogen hydrolase [Candidatus Krumholzibacteria bacterium]MDP7021002.1 nitrilase-related carbon-nitrogen hydrolase [Candidatus Krumholzibacteria bacterium]
MKLALHQMDILPGRGEANRRKILQAISSLDADLHILPELAESGYARSRLQFEEHCEEFSSLEIYQEFVEHRNTALIMGLPLKEGYALYNAAVLLRPKEEAVFYRKIHLFDREKNCFDPGHLPPEVHEHRGMKLGMMICFDWVFPEMARSLALQGADLIAHPANLVMPGLCQTSMKTRALENAVFVATANRIGREEFPDGSKLCFTGESQVLSPRGERLLRLSAGDEGSELVNIDPREARDKMITAGNHLMEDRRPELYRLEGQ